MTKHAALLGLVLLGARPAFGEAANTVLTNGKIFTSRASKPWVQALAIRGERIVGAGTTEEIRHLAGPGARTIDLGGRTVIPGFNDAHRHLDINPPGMVEVKTEAVDPSWTELSAALSAAAARAPKDALLSAEIGYAVFSDPRVDRRALDTISLAQPILLWTLTGHAAILNSPALAKLRIEEKQPDPVAGRFERTPDGRLSGVVREYAALGLSRRLADLASDDETVQQLRDAFSEAVRWGVTTIQDMSEAIEPGRCARLLARVSPPLRVRIIPMPGTTPGGRDRDEG
ncbi:MAG TPA: amidohydrolase family protein, partial [Myxococcaceae bacterium]|nr:amidohydrolase family protein [Myxococcaceae bacterium]